MKLTILKENVIEGMQKAASIIPAKSGAAYLRSLWLKAGQDTLSLMSTDANIEFTGIYPAKVEKEGLLGVQGRAFVDLVRQLPDGELTLNFDEEANILLLSQGRRKYKLPVNDVTWFQPFSDFLGENSISWSGDFFQDLIEKVNFCISDDDASEALSCLYMKDVGNGRIECCGLNGHQFALKSFINDDLAAILPADGMLVQKKYVQEIKKWLGVEEIDLSIGEKRLYLRTSDGRETFSLPRSIYTYPDYMSFMSRLAAPNTSLLEVRRKECMDALGRLAIFNSDDRCTYFTLSPAELSLAAQGHDIGSADEIIEITYNGSLKKIAFPTKNLMDVMGHYDSENLALCLTSTEGPCGISGKDDPDYTVIIMPMKIVDNAFYKEEK